MKTTIHKAKLLTLILVGTTAIAGCSSFESPSAGYVKPGELCTDVSNLPDPNAPPKKESDPLQTLANQYGIGGRRDESPERLLMQADSYFEQKRYHDSARLYKKYLAIADLATASPDLLGTIHYRIGYVAAKKTFHAEAKSEFAQALQFAPLNNEYLFGYAKACYDAGDFQEADRQFSALVARAPGYPEANRYYGLTLLEGANRANALQPLTTSVGALEACRLLADKYYEVGELELAARLESQAIQIAAQTAQPIPQFPHKEQLLINAQNATYAQTLNVMNAAPTPNASTPFVSQYAAPAVQPVQPVQPVQNPAPVAVANPAVAVATPGIVRQNDVAVPQNSVVPTPPSVNPAPVAHPGVVAPEATQNLTSSSDQPTPVAPPVDPIADAYKADAPSQFTSLAPVQENANPVAPTTTQFPTPVVSADALQGRFPAFVGQPAQNDAVEPNASNEAREFKVFEPLVGPTSTTSGSGYFSGGAAPNAGQLGPSGIFGTTNVAPSTTIAPIAPTTQGQTSTEEKSQFQSIQPSFTQIASPQDAEAETSAVAMETRSNPRPRLVGYLEAPTVEDSQDETIDDEIDASFEKQPVSMIATKLTAPTEPQEDVIQFNENFKDASQSDDVAKSKKRTIKTNVNVGRGNPGLFVSTAATKHVEKRAAFRPGSIAESADVDLNSPDEFAVRFARENKRRETAIANTRNREREWASLQARADALFEGYAFVDQNALAYYVPILVSPNDDDEWDDAAFAASGAAPMPAPEPAIGGFGDYAPPTDELASWAEPIYVAQLTETPAPQPSMQQIPAQQVPVQQVPMQQIPAQQIPVQQVPAQQIPVQQVPALQIPVQQVPTQQIPVQQVPAQQIPLQQVPAQQVPVQQVLTPQIPVQQIPAQQIPVQQVQMQPIPVQQAQMQPISAQQVPVAQLTRSQTTPEERLEAARRAGAEIVELSPDQYRRAMTAGLGAQPAH